MNHAPYLGSLQNVWGMNIILLIFLGIHIIPISSIGFFLRRGGRTVNSAEDFSDMGVAVLQGVYSTPPSLS